MQFVVEFKKCMIQFEAAKKLLKEICIDRAA
jgi:hypothetical protein